VLIKRFDFIPGIIELAGKTLKMDDKQKMRKQQSMEALGCPCKHPSVIEFLAIHVIIHQKL
jgi:hypothetical protein